MRFEGIHHITCITADAPGNVDFYARVLGLRLVKKSVNQDDPTVYHLFYADEAGSYGSDLTFFEYPGAARGEPGAGMIHRVVWRVGSTDARDFWQERLAAAGVASERSDGRLLFHEPSGVLFEIATIGPGFTVDEPLEHLGEKLSLPPDFEHLRERVEPLLTPLPDPRRASVSPTRRQ